MAEVISFKVFLTRENVAGERKPEIRRFGIDFDVVANYDYLCEKLQTVFPELRGRRFSITWKDSEDDDIMISSCEELQIALTEMQNDPIRKLYVTLHSEYEEAKSVFQAEGARAATGPANKEKHVGIVCDGCDKDIFGFGYKCLRCVDYDLCTDCEAKGSHPEHCMIRFPTPQQRKLHKGKCLFRPIDVKVVTEEDTKKHSHKHRRHSGGQNYHGHNQIPSWLNTLTTYLNDWAYLPEECPASEAFKKNNNANKSTGYPPYPSTSRNSSPPAEEKPAEVRTNVQSKPEEKPAEVRTNVQSKPEEKPAAAEAVPTSSQPESPAKTVPVVVASSSPVEVAHSVPIPTAPLQDKIVSSVQSLSSSSSSECSSVAASPKDDWTLVDNTDIPTASAPSPTPSVQKTAPEVPKMPIGQQMYPSLPNVSDNVYHPDPKIQRAVDAMIQMGFTNEGGWLTQLLVLKNGDISKVLDILQPVNPKNK